MIEYNLLVEKIKNSNIFTYEEKKLLTDQLITSFNNDSIISEFILNNLHARKHETNYKNYSKTLDCLVQNNDTHEFSDREKKIVINKYFKYK